MEQFIIQYWPQLGALVGFAFWVGSLSSIVKSNHKELSSEIRRLQHQRNEDVREQKEAREHTNRLIENLDRKMDTALGEIRTDIKDLIRASNATVAQGKLFGDLP